MTVQKYARALSCSLYSGVHVRPGTSEAYLRADPPFDHCFGNVSDGGLCSNLFKLLTEHLSDFRIIASWRDGGVNADEPACEVNQILLMRIDPAVNIPNRSFKGHGVFRGAKGTFGLNVLLI